MLFCMGVKHGVNVFGESVLRKIFGSKREGITEDGGKNCIVRILVICARHRTLLVIT